MAAPAPSREQTDRRAMPPPPPRPRPSGWQMRCSPTGPVLAYRLVHLPPGVTSDPAAGRPPLRLAAVLSAPLPTAAAAPSEQQQQARQLHQAQQHFTPDQAMRAAVADAQERDVRRAARAAYLQPMGHDLMDITTAPVEFGSPEQVSWAAQDSLGPGVDHITDNILFSLSLVR